MHWQVWSGPVAWPRRVAVTAGRRDSGWGFGGSSDWASGCRSSALASTSGQGSGAVAGFDLTVRAPKSVSVLFGIGEPDLAGRLRVAHETAVEEALGYLEREACQARRGHAGALVVDGRGFIGAAFAHRTSRAG